LALQNLPAAPEAEATKRPHETWQSLDRWCQVNRLPAPARLSGGASVVYSLFTSNRVFVLRSGSRIAFCDGLEFRLGFDPRMIDGQLFLHALDLEKNIQPLMTGTLLPAEKIKKSVVIDPGHGGENAGTRSVLAGHYEKEYTLDWAMRLGSLLASNGWEVALTRTNDIDIALSNRVSFADTRNADLFISLHFNSGSPDTTQAGVETYCLTPMGMPSTVTRNFSDDSSLLFANNSFDSQNLLLAYRVHRALLRIGGNHDRGVRRARFLGVLRGQQRPAILVEGGYLSNPHEAELIADPAYRQKLAQAVAGALGGRSALVTELTEATQTSAAGFDPKLAPPHLSVPTTTP
jgi:N-acetylmuramoyl-L-alanine amidase